MTEYALPRGFDAWRAKVDAICWARLGLSIDDLPDCPLIDWYEDGYGPSAAVTKARRFAEGED